MKVLMPIHDPRTIEAVSGGSGEIELYAGFEDPAWYARFGIHEDMNRMSAFRAGANLSTAHLETIASAAQARQYSLFVTVNAGIYSLAQARWLENTLRHVRECGATGVILGDPCMVPHARALGLKAVASTMVGVYHADMARWAKEIGFDRVILPRDITLAEAEAIMQTVPELEYECFLMRNGCRYSDSHCLCRHSDRFGAICTDLDRADVQIHGAGSSFAEREAAHYNHYVFARAFHQDACGICSIWRWMQMGVTAGKVVGRADAAGAVLQDVDLILRNIDIASRCVTEAAYLDSMIFPARSPHICIKGVCCYYPEIRYGEE